MNKKSIIITIILTFIVAFLTMYVTSTATSFSVGETAQLGMGYPHVTLTDKNGNVVPGSKNLMNSANYDYFCAHRGVPFTSKDTEYGKAIAFYNIAKVEIVGDTAKLTAGKKYGSMSSNLYTETYTETKTNSNKVLAQLFYEIKDGKVTIDEVTSNGTKTGRRVTIARQRSSGGRYAFTYDYGQFAMWRNLFDWQKNVAIKMDTQKQSLWNKLASTIQSEQIVNTFGNSEAASLAYEQGKQLYSEVVNKVNKMTIENEYGIEETYYKDSSSDKRVETRIDADSYTILGPFQYNFSGEIQNGKPTLTFNSSQASQQYTIGTYVGSTFTETNKIVSGNKFYIKVKTTALNGVTHIHFNFQIEGISVYNTKTTVYFFERNVNFSSFQPIMHIDQQEGYNKPFKDSYRISKPVDISLEKLDEGGNALKVEGITFQLKDITNAVVAYFKTDANGNGIITDANGNPTGKATCTILSNQKYTLIETSNNIYGYRGCYLDANNIKISGAKIEQSGNNITFVLDDSCPDQVTIEAKNQKELATIELEKTGEDGAKLENVEFVIKIGEAQFIQLKDINDQVVNSIKGTVTINTDNKASKVEYRVEYVTDKNSATRFLTDSNGKITVNNLEINKSSKEKYDYTAYEVHNPNYGYGSAENTSLKETLIELELNETNQIKMKNVKKLGDLELKKYDEDNHNIMLPNVGFIIEVSPSSEKTYAYLAIYNTNGQVVSSIGETAKINSNNQAQDLANGREYELGYYYSDKSYSEMTENEKAQITTFVTGEDGTLSISNLEVYSRKTGGKYTYKLIEVSNSNYGFIPDSVELGKIELEPNEKSDNELGNKQKYTKLSGYVWLENSENKTNHYDGVYNGTADKKLTDLYITDENGIKLNENAEIQVQIKLRKKDGTIIKDKPDQFDNETGKYTFIDVEISELVNYEVIFIYNGFYYTTIAKKLNEANGSKANELQSERTELNDKFAVVKDNNEVVSKDGTVNKVEYNKDGHKSTVSKLHFDTTISATTGEADYNLRDEFDSVKAAATKPVETLDNVNMGIVLREQPKISINSDIYSALIEFEGYKYNYKYNGRHDYYENVNDEKIGVKFEQEYTAQRYTRTVYSSDIQAAKEQGKEIKLSITYNIKLANQSTTLNVMPRQIINYFDARYSIKSIGLTIDEGHIATNTLTYSEAQNVEGHPEYKSTIIDFNQLIGIASPEDVKDLYITFDVSRDAILDLLNNKSTYHNASEILSYTSYYGESTSISNGERFISDTSKPGSVYAGIDKMSEPGNMEITLIDYINKDGNPDGTKVLDQTNFEEDTTSAPSLILEAKESRKISGTIWEDSVSNTENNQKLGNGIFESGENPIANVTVGLYKVNEDGTIGDLATYSNGDQVKVITNESGEYTFGKYELNDDGTVKEFYGVLPGKYVIKYTYNNESYIVNANGNTNLNVNDYKSTIITSELIKNAFNGGNARWYVTQEDNRYSDARDNLDLRPEYNPDLADVTITNSTYNTIYEVTTMDAHTPIMDVGIEFTETDESDALVLELNEELINVDFGIIERPDIDIEIKKEITSLEIVAQNGTRIIPKGDPTDINSRMQYVKCLEGLVSVEIEAKLLQSAQLNLEYTITLVNNSDRDYFEKEYYYYGTGGITENTSRAKQVADYLDFTMSLDPNQNQSATWTEVKAEDLYKNDGNAENDFISEQVYNELKSGDYHILTTNAFADVGAGSEKSIKLYAVRTLASSDSIREENSVEIIELTGRRTIKDSVPGNCNPAADFITSELDDGKVDLLITPPTGSTVNYILYIIAGAATLAILLLGIVIIKKKIIK